jgi:hypothetical protein
MADYRAGRRAAEDLIHRTGYDGTADAVSDRALVRTGVGQHEDHMHPGRARTKLRLQGGVERTMRLGRWTRSGLTGGRGGMTTVGGADQPIGARRRAAS